MRAEATVEELREALGGPLPEGPTPTRRGRPRARRGCRAGRRRDPERPLLRLRDRRRRAGGARGRLAHVDVGPERGPVRRRAFGGGRRGGRRRGWLAELLGLPEGVSGAFVTGCQMAHVTALAAARHAVLERVGWDVAARRASSARRRSACSRARERHVDVRPRAAAARPRARVLFARSRADDQGADARGRAARALDERDGADDRLRAGRRVNTGAFDPLDGDRRRCEAAGAWLHVDGAFGLWAAAVARASPPHRRGRARRLVGDRRATSG